MLRFKSGFPEEGEFVLCLVTKVQFHSVFVKLEEYNRTGVIHISEVSPGRIRNIRDFVKEGKVIVCKVLRINKEKGHIDLSLRRVTESQRREKVNEIKQERLAEKILEFVARELKRDVKDIFNSIEDKVFSRYDLLYSCFEDVIKNENILKELNFPKELISPLTEAIKQRIKPVQVEVNGKFILKIYAADGVELIKKCLKTVEVINKDLIRIYYMGAGAYKITITSEDYKTAEKILGEAKDRAIDFMEKNNGQAEFVRIEK